MPDRSRFAHLSAAAAAEKRMAVRISARLGKHQRESAVKGVARAERVDDIDAECRELTQLAAFEPQHIVAPVRHGEKRRGALGEIDQPAAKTVDAGRRAQALGRKHDMRCDAEQIVAVVTRLVGVEHGRHAALARCVAAPHARTPGNDCLPEPHRRPPQARRHRLAWFQTSARRGNSRSRVRRDRRW